MVLLHITAGEVTVEPFNLAHQGLPGDDGDD
jgi:hypothetical protein